ncbi:allophanate hydrolase [Echinimonas agarilytica]|uniref:Allophanate hydrolase n=1 Tax=Echinimonas agarilytica TaxID=1215918 RepID=A0AA41W4M8_9GAMM|nr:allophanate hydrolase [Echinimonas agarilytica]MCM2678681.1 allophanate hydrolase [Echinimonas agarilytica]
MIYPTIDALQNAYRSDDVSPKIYLKQQLNAAREDQTCSWISLISDDDLAAYLGALEGKSADDLPLYGVPFAIKDNIDLQGLPTTAGCREYAYQPEDSAFVVQQLIAAGAVPLGKTNMDQFATGLVGTRSPWGAVSNSHNAEYISGGSSSGSAVAVATAQVCFSLGTDTAGSGRVPAAFNNILGMKATKGLVSCSGVVPACKSLDCVTLFAHTADDLNILLQVAAHYDASDCYARTNLPNNHADAYQPANSLAGTRIGVPKAHQMKFFGNNDCEALFERAIKVLEQQGAELVEIDFQPFIDAAKLLYEGPWVAERYAAIEDFFNQDASRCLPVIQTIVGGAEDKTASDAFKAMYRLQAYKVECDALLAKVDAVMTPTAGTIYTIDEVNQNPIELNSNVGYYTNFMNLLDYAAVAVPAGIQSTGLPFGVTLFSSAYSDRKLLSLAGQLQHAYDLPLGATGQPLQISLNTNCEIEPDTNWVELAVCGAHLQGLPLNPQLVERNAELLEDTSTSPHYQLYALPGGPPFRPGLVRAETSGCCIAVEVWRMPLENLGSFLQGIPQPLGLGKVELNDGRWVISFICEGYAITEAKNISQHGGWRAYLASLDNAKH